MLAVWKWFSHFSSFTIHASSYYLRQMKWLAFAAIIILVIAGFQPWIYVPSKDLTITGVSAMNFGKPAYLHFVFAGFCLIFLLINRNWSHKVAVFFAAFNVAWSLRNFFVIGACSMGDCPLKKMGIYLIVISSLLLLFSVLLQRRQPHKREMVS